MTVTFVVAVEEHVPRALATRATMFASQEREWMAKRRAEMGVDFLRGGERRAVLRQIRQMRDELRAVGELRGTQSGLMTFHTGRVLTAKGWDGVYPALPAGEAAVPGRPVGRSPDPDLPLSARLAVELPDQMGEQVRRAAYWVSEPAVRELHRWDERFGRGPAAGGVEGFVAEMRSAMGSGPRAEDLRRREELRAQVVTVGDILRAAAAAALA